MLSAAAAAIHPAPPKNGQQLPAMGPFTLVDDSLTDIRWLGSMDPQFPSLEHSDKTYRGISGGPMAKGRKKLSYGKSKMAEDGTKSDSDNIRPPFSYAALIALAINSHPQNMLTLNSIYRWIEENFPFFRTPEARAWKNSIRHNLSIKKNLFQKVYIDPPRRGNGAYWTLLTDGLEEVERCMKLLTTLRPPVIDPSSIYFNQGSTLSQTIRSRGKFIPIASHHQDTSPTYNNYYPTVHMEGNEHHSINNEKENIYHHHHHHVSSHTHHLIHPLEQHHTTSVGIVFPTQQQICPPSIQPFLPPNIIEHNKPSSHDTSSNSLFDLSCLTPLKGDNSLVNISDLNNITLSPFLSYLTKSQAPPPPPLQGTLSRTPNTNNNYTNLSPLCTPSKPFGSVVENESGVYFSPSVKFSTPVKDIHDMLPGCTPNKREASGYYESSTPTPLRWAEYKHL